jgi:hypothetical protein
VSWCVSMTCQAFAVASAFEHCARYGCVSALETDSGDAGGLAGDSRGNAAGLVVSKRRSVLLSCRCPPPISA